MNGFAAQSFPTLEFRPAPGSFIRQPTKQLVNPQRRKEAALMLAAGVPTRKALRKIRKLVKRKKREGVI
jgi:hypothetical protein